MAALLFLTALSLLQNQPTPDFSLAARTLRIKCAAYASVAHSAGPGRAWGRALIRELRRQRRPSTRISGFAGRGRRPALRNADGRRSSGGWQGRRRASTAAAAAAEGLLRRVVPGGRGMDCCSLLEETADYIKCLSTQVRLMQTIADSCLS